MRGRTHALGDGWVWELTGERRPAVYKRGVGGDIVTASG